tara:strand:- start:9107 stop:10003 length:897 start_codon:yes stop_codon:yes gene_type:complete
MDYEKFLWDCKKAGELGISKIPKDSGVITSIEGMSTPNIRHTLNNLNRWGSNYLEVGSHKGSTFVSSLYGHTKNGWSIDNYSEFCDAFYRPGSDGKHTNELLTNIKKYLTCKTQFFDSDSFSFDISNISEKVDVYMYDGDHDQDKQKKAIEYFYPVLSDTFLFIVDDWNSQAVRDGTYDGIKSNDLSILSEMHIRCYGTNQSDWWSGLYVAFLSKQCPKDRFLQTSLAAGGCNFAHPIKRSRPRDNVLRLSQPENGKTIEQIKEILSENFPSLTEGDILFEIKEGLKLLDEQKSRGIF